MYMLRNYRTVVNHYFTIMIVVSKCSDRGLTVVQTGDNPLLFASSTTGYLTE